MRFVDPSQILATFSEYLAKLPVLRCNPGLNLCRSIVILCTTVILGLSWCQDSLADEGTRVALVIGNSAYREVPLKQPVNDAEDISRALRTLGFDVITKTDVTKRELLDVLDTFSGRLENADIGLFFFTGHGMQFNGLNYLLPVGTDVHSAEDVEYEALQAGLILDSMVESGSPLNIVILDACRNNPFHGLSQSPERGLAVMDAPIGSVIAYAASPGSTGTDGSGRNGIYTKNLLRAMQKPGLSVQEMFNEAGIGVIGETGSRQVPWVNSSPMAPVYLTSSQPGPIARPVSSFVEKKTGTVKVSSNPTGADVNYKGVVVGTTPLDLQDLTIGDTITVSVSKDGFISQDQVVQVNDTGQKKLDFTLEKVRTDGWLTITTIPADARVRILNIKKRYQPRMKLAGGKYQVEVSASGYKTKTKWVELADGSDLELDVILKQTKVVSQPPPRKESLFVTQKAPEPTTQAAPAVVTAPAVVAKKPAVVAEPEKKPDFIDPRTGMEFVFVKGGCYQMGDIFDEGGNNEKPVHEVCLEDFYIGKYEVTQGEYQQVMETNPSSNRGNSKLPVEQVGWNSLEDFLEKISNLSAKNYRLPTEAEWEYAARSGGKKERYSGSDSPSDVAWFQANSGGTTRMVGKKKANGLGIHDMSGNVWEFCADEFSSNFYHGSVKNNPIKEAFHMYIYAKENHNVIRGGGFKSDPDHLRSTHRGRNFTRVYGRDGGKRSAVIGFRLVFSAND